MPNDKEVERTDWDNFTEGDLEVLANLSQFLEEEREREKEAARAVRRIWDEALDMANNPELFGYNVPID
jgi:hypothetical protein